MRGQRTVWGGRQQVRSALDMAVLVASRFDPAIRAFHQRLASAGKAKKRALTAALRKPVVILNAILRTGTPWRAMGARQELATSQSLVPSSRRRRRRDWTAYRG